MRVQEIEEFLVSFPGYQDFSIRELDKRVTASKVRPEPVVFQVRPVLEDAFLFEAAVVYLDPVSKADQPFDQLDALLFLAQLGLAKLLVELLRCVRVG